MLSIYEYDGFQNNLKSVFYYQKEYCDEQYTFHIKTLNENLPIFIKILFRNKVKRNMKTNGSFACRYNVWVLLWLDSFETFWVSDLAFEERAKLKARSR